MLNNNFATIQEYKEDLDKRIKSHHCNLRLQELNNMSLPFFDATKNHLNVNSSYEKFNEKISPLNYVYKNKKDELIFKCKIALQNIKIDSAVYSKSYRVIKNLTHYTIIHKEFDNVPYNPLLFDDMNNQKCIRIAIKHTLASNSLDIEIIFDEIQKVVIDLLDSLGIMYNNDDIYIS
jgi:hypothetical protein